MAAAATTGTAPVASPWWHKLRWRAVSHPEGLAAEHALLSIYGTPTVSQVETQVGPTNQHTMHSLHGGTVGPPMVAIPGYGAGAGFFFKNFSWLTSRFKVHAVDLLGTGLSGRPPFTSKNQQEAEDFFINALETWRETHQLEKFILVGHSMGGYLSAAYALKHPERVQHLVLVGCAGVGKRPDDWKPPEALRGSLWSLRANMFRAALWGWDAGWTPGMLVRTLGPWGKRLVRNYATRRFGFQAEEVAPFEQYLYNILAADGSGEFALRHILEPFAWPRVALEERLPVGIQGVGEGVGGVQGDGEATTTGGGKGGGNGHGGVQHSTQQNTLNNTVNNNDSTVSTNNNNSAFATIPISFIYGEHDWMDPKHGARVCQQLKQLRTPLNASDLQLYLIDDAGHNPFLEQPERFHDALAEALRPWLTGEKKHLVHTVASESALPVHPDDPPQPEAVAADL